MYEHNKEADREIYCRQARSCSNAEVKGIRCKKKKIDDQYIIEFSFI